MRTMLIATTLAACVVTGLVLCERAAVAQDRDDAAGNAAAAGTLDADALRTDLEVLRRILGTQALHPSGESLDRTVYWVPRAAVDVDYVSGQGLVISLDVDFALNRDEPQKASSTDGESSLWEQVLADVEGRQRVATPGDAPAFDAERVKQFESALFECVGTYAGKVRALRGDESVTVIARGRGAPRFSRLSVTTGAPSATDRPAASVRSSPEGTLRVTATGAGAYVYGLNGGASTWAFRVRAADVRLGLPAADLRSRATETRY